MVEKVLLASPRGFCAGVVRAVDIVRIALEIYEAPIYVRKEIVHNAFVVDELSRKGVRFVDELDEVPPGRLVIFSAHGVSPAVREAARARQLRVIDATCPLVTKVHLEAKRYARRGYTIVLIGHEGHEEVEGTMGEARLNMKLICKVEDVETLQIENSEKVAYLTQTTLSLDDTRAIIQALRKKFPAIEGPPSEDICYATQNRQLAVRKLAEQADLILVVGARNSSNSNRLVEEALRHGSRSFLIDSVDSIQADWLEGVKIVGVTSGASAPETLVQEVLSYFVAGGAEVIEVVTRVEDVSFALPPNLKADAKARLAEKALLAAK